MDSQQKKTNFLDEKVFFDLTNLNNGFDSPSIKYFNADDFEIVLQRIEEHNVGLYGIEPWLDGKFYDVATCEDFNKEPTDPEWYRSAFEEFKQANINLQYAASYFIPTIETQ